MFEITWVYEFTFSTVNIMKSKYRSSISNQNLASKLRSLENKLHTGIWRFNTKSVKYCSNEFYIDYLLNR